MNGKHESGSEDFAVPEFGFNMMMGDKMSFGVTIYGNGGMNTDYKNGVPLLNNFGTNRTGIDYSQLFVAPTLTWKVTPNHIVGVAVNLAYQRFEAKGLQSFVTSSTSGTNLTDRGHDNSYGAGLHLGWIGKVSDTVTLGATYQTKTYMSKFDKYKGLFAEQGDIDVPATYGVGIAVQATPQLTVAADVQRILYSDVASIGNLSLSNLQNGLGASNGAGFGWRDVTATKLGVSYAYSEALTLRAGYDHSTQPVRSGETFFNILAPGVVQDHLTLGGTWTLANKDEISFSYVHAFTEKVNGSNSIPAGFGGGEANLKMSEDAIGIAYGWKL